MLITINGVSVEKHPKGYSVANVAYVRDGKEETRKVLSFNSVDVFRTLSLMRDFPREVNVVLEKDSKTGYWMWKAIEQADAYKGANEPVTNGASAPRPVTTRTTNFETPEERAKKQVYIVRQSSISSAIEMAKAVEPKGVTKDRQAILEDAKAFEQYVLDVQETTDEVV